MAAHAGTHAQCIASNFIKELKGQEKTAYKQSKNFSLEKKSFGNSVVFLELDIVLIVVSVAGLANYLLG